MSPNAPAKRATARRLQPDLAEIDAGAERRLDGLGPAARENLHRVAAGIFAELVEFEIAVIVGGGRRDRRAVLEELHAGALDAIDRAVLLLRHRAADEAFRIAPQVAVIDSRTRPEFGLHHVELFVLGEPRHLVVLDLDGAHGAGRAGLLAAGLLPAL